MIAGKGVPLLGEEGWLRHQENAAKPPYEGADGVVSPGERFDVNIYHNDHPVCAASEASRLFLTGAATPPVPGGEHPVLAIHSHLHRAPLQLLRSGIGWLAHVALRCCVIVDAVNGARIWPSCGMLAFFSSASNAGQAVANDALSSSP